MAHNHTMTQKMKCFANAVELTVQRKDQKILSSRGQIIFKLESVKSHEILKFQLWSQTCEKNAHLAAKTPAATPSFVCFESFK